MVTKRRWEQERQRDIHLAYQCVRIFIMSQKPTPNGTAWELPQFAKLVAVPKRRQTGEEALQVIRFLSKQSGFPLKEIPVGQ